jgi:hypothetical protein
MVIARFAKIWYSKKDASSRSADVQKKRKEFAALFHHSILIIARIQQHVNFVLLARQYFLLSFIIRIIQTAL